VESLLAEKDEENKKLEAKKKAAKAAAKKKAAAKAAKGEQAVKLAKKFQGTPYVYGASGPDAFDCSGLTSYVYGKLGIKLTHNAQAQFNECKSVSLSSIKPGDLVFFGGGTGSISHVGMYVGNDTYIHAPRPGAYVRIDSFSARADCVGACRPY